MRGNDDETEYGFSFIDVELLHGMGKIDSHQEKGGISFKLELEDISRRPGNSSVMYDVTCVVGSSNAVDTPVDVRLPKLFRLSLVEGVVEVPAVPHVDSSHRTRLKMKHISLQCPSS